MRIPSKEEFCRAVEEFERREKRDAMYKVATFLVSYCWGNPSDMADGLGVLLLTWNQAFYRYGAFDFDRLEECVAGNFQQLDGLRAREIVTLSESDEGHIGGLFDEFLSALQIDSGKARGRKSPVGVAKALHLLAPAFFPLWDYRIARAYKCYYQYRPSEKYVSFCKIMRSFVEEVRGFVERSDVSMLKLVDEYNYSIYTKEWI